MARVPTTTIRTDPDVKDRANEVFDGLGLSLSAAVNVFLKAVVCEGGMPFDVKISAKLVPAYCGEPQPERERADALTCAVAQPDGGAR